MAISAERCSQLEALCGTIRQDVLRTLYQIQTGHPGGSLSVCEILTALYMECANISKDNLDDMSRDRIVLTKGHAAPILYRLLAEIGVLEMDELVTLRQVGSRLQGHPCAAKTPGVELSTGPLGIGLPAALGMALALRQQGYDSFVYAVMGDGELDEGAVWEAAMSAAKMKADHLIAIVDWNKVQLDGPVDAVMPLGDLEGKWRSFGWNVLRCDGHSIRALVDTIELAKRTAGSPTVILADTIKGKGVSFMEGKNTYHGKALTREEYEKAIRELGGVL